MVDHAPVLKRQSVAGAAVLDPKTAYGDKAVTGDARRGTASQRGYNSRWYKARKTVLKREPLCRVSDQLNGITAAAQVLDHWYPASGLSWLFWERKLWVPMTKRMHDSWKQDVELKGEAMLDHYALQLGLPTLADLHPERIGEWRQAYAERRRFGQ